MCSSVRYFGCNCREEINQALEKFQQEDCLHVWQSELTPYGYCITLRPPQTIDTYGITGKIIDLSFTIR